MESVIENRRKHKRFKVGEGVSVVSPERYCHVLNISEGGLAVKIVDSSEDLPDVWSAFFYCSNSDTMISGLPLKCVREERMQLSELSSVPTQSAGVFFDNPNALQQRQIQQYISGLS